MQLDLLRLLGVVPEDAVLQKNCSTQSIDPIWCIAIDDVVAEAGELQDLAHNSSYSLNVEMKEEVNECGETLMRSTAESSAPNINGADYDDSLWGTTAPENMYGGAGHDWIVGGAGADTFIF